MTGTYERLIGRTADTSATGAVGGQVAEGVIHHLDLGGAYFTMPAFDGGQRVFGPSPWNQALVEPTTVTDSNGDSETHTHSPTQPAPGAACLVVWVNSVPGVRNGRWWVLAWWGSG